MRVAFRLSNITKPSCVKLPTTPHSWLRHALGRNCIATAMSGSLEAAGIVPGSSNLVPVVDSVAASTGAEVHVEFGGGKIVANGNTLSPAETADTPTATIKGGKQGRLYTLVATDPDAPDPANPTRGEWLHWLVTNIPGGGSASQGAEVVSYMGPAPPVGTHRYIFLLYQQPFQEPLQADDPSGGDAGKRSSFKVKHWAKEHGLGDPVAVTWFNSHK